jgi:hypothetical protein
MKMSRACLFRYSVYHARSIQVARYQFTEAVHRNLRASPSRRRGSIRSALTESSIKAAICLCIIRRPLLCYRVYSATRMLEACLSASKLSDFIILLYRGLSTACSLSAPTLTVIQRIVYFIVKIAVNTKY